MRLGRDGMPWGWISGVALSARRRFPGEYHPPPEAVYRMWRAEGGDRAATATVAAEWGISEAQVRFICRSRMVARRAMRGRW